MSPYFQKDNFYYFLILIAAGTLCFFNLGGHPIYILDEAKNAEAALEMWANNNWIVPTFNGELRTDKPVLHYWFMMLAYKIFGISAFSARFFSAIFGVLTILASFHFTKKFINRKVAGITAFVLCSAIFFVQEFHLAVPDPYLIFFVSFALFNFYDYYQNGKKSNGLIFYISLGLGTLAKGPVALVLPGLIIFLFLWLKKDFKLKTILRLNPFLGLILTLLIVLPWFYWVHKATDGAFTQGFFFEHNLQRFSAEKEGHGGLPIVTWAFVILGLLPYSFFVVQGFIQGWKKRYTHDFLLFSFLISIVIIGFFSISLTKLPNYPMPAYPFLAVLISYYLVGIIEKKFALKAYKISLWIWLAVSFLLPIGGYVALVYAEPHLYSVRYLSILLAILPVGAVCAFYYLKRNKILESVIVLGMSSMFLSLELFQSIYPKLVAQSPLVLAKDVMDKDSKVILYKGYDPAFLFNFERNFPFAETTEEVISFLRENPQGMVITKEKFYDSDWKEIPSEILLKQKALFENYTIVIFRLK